MIEDDFCIRDSNGCVVLQDVGSSPEMLVKVSDFVVDILVLCYNMLKISFENQKPGPNNAMLANYSGAPRWDFGLRFR